MISENSNCEISSIYSPVLLENASEYFFAKGNFFSKSDGTIYKMTQENASVLPEKFREVCRIISAPHVFVKEGKVSFYLKRNKVEILENNSKVEVLFNGNKVSSSELAKNMVSAGLFRLEESQIAYDVQSIAESFENIFDLDFGKVISSKVHEGSYVILMKEGDNIYLNKVNESSNSNEFFSKINTTQARNIILEFLGFDIKESFSEYLAQDEILLKELRESQLEIMKNISILEANIVKVNNTLEDSFLSNTPELISIKELLENEIDELKKQHKDLTNKIKTFESKATSDAKVEVTDEVIIEGSTDVFTVTSINSSRGTVSVVDNNGKTKEISVTKIRSAESDLNGAAEKNTIEKKKI